MYSKDFVNRAVFVYKQLYRSLRRTAEIFGVGKTSLHRWVRSAGISTRSRKPRKSKIDKVIHAVQGLLEQNQFARQKDIVQAVRKQTGIAISCSTSARCIRQAGFTRKRTHYRHVSKPLSISDVDDYLGQIERPGEKISIDEACLRVQSAPIYGYSRKGTRLVKVTRGKRKTEKLTLVMAISNTRGVIQHSVIPGNCDTETFTDFLNNLDVSHGTSILMDNVRFHHSNSVRNALCGKGCIPVYTPPYQPDFNPIENAFHVIKSAMRRGACFDAARNAVTTNMCAAFFERSRCHAEDCRACMSERT